MKLAETLGNVSKVCNVMGYSRDSFYRFQELYEKGGELALQDLSRRKPNHKNRIEPEKEEAVKKMAIDFPAYGQQRASNELDHSRPATVRSVWVRHDLETFQKRLKALEAFMAQGDSPVLTESQVLVGFRISYFSLT